MRYLMAYMNKKNLTLKDIAALSGVGKSTVSLVINKSPRVKTATRERVEAVIREYGYTPSLTARALRAQREKIIGIIMTRLDSAAENRAIRAILAEAYQAGYDAILQESMLDPRRLEEHLHVLESRRVEGVILFGFSGMDDVDLTPWQHRLVLIARQRPGFASVTYDDSGAVDLLMARLHASGRRNVSFIGVDEQDHTTGRARYQAYLAGCKRYGFSGAARLGDLSYQSGFMLAETLLDQDSEALICATDTLALGALKSIQARGLQVDVSSIGSTPLLAFLHPEVTSVRLGFAKAGLRALHMLLEMQHDKAAGGQLVLPCSLED